MVKFADDTTLVGLITKSDETHYRKEVNLLTTWCRDNNLLLNVSKTKGIVVDFRKSHTVHPPLTIDGAAVERVSSTKFLGVHISEDLSWAINSASLAKKAQRRLYFLRKLKRAKAHSLFSLLPSGRRYRSLYCRTTRLRNGFIHQAVRKLNSLPSLPPAISVSRTWGRSAEHTSELQSHLHL